MVFGLFTRYLLTIILHLLAGWSGACLVGCATILQFFFWWLGDKEIYSLHRMVISKYQE